jgi:hypothetical protein
MKTLHIQVTDQKVLNLLKDLEDIDLIKVLKDKVTPKKKLSEKYAGKLPGDIADEMQKYIAESR